MAEYIKKWPVVDKLTALENELQQYKPFRHCEATMYRRVCDVEIEIGKMDAEDVAPVVHGRWICDPDPGKVRLVCSVCGQGMPFVPEYLPGLPPYCNCGARMDKEADHE